MAIEGKYGIITAEKKQFHADEPVFLLRATDPLAPAAIREYAHLCEARGCAYEHIKECMEHARRIQAWQAQNPTLVKRLPD